MRLRHCTHSLTQGTLDVPGTFLAIDKGFEKFEKLTVGHVRVLEERMNDVEKWLVDNENEKNKATPLPQKQPSNTPDVMSFMKFQRCLSSKVALASSGGRWRRWRRYLPTFPLHRGAKEPRYP